MTYKQWQDFAQKVDAMGKRIDDALHAKGWALAESVGIGRCMCSLHNASIDDELRGWCHNNPHRLKVAKQANHLVNQWDGHHRSEAIVRRAWNKMAKTEGYCQL